MCITSQAYATSSVILQEKKLQCDKVHKSRILRLNNEYSLTLGFYNHSDSEMILGDYSINFYGGDYGGNGIPEYHWNDWIKSKNGIIKPTESGTILSSDKYTIVNIPPKRAFDNLLVQYTTKYKTLFNGKPIGFSRSYISCQPYEISWCGDGVLEQEYDEMCDPADPQKQGWGVGGCNPKTCQPIEQKTVVDLLKQKSLVLDSKLPNIKPI